MNYMQDIPLDSVMEGGTYARYGGVYRGMLDGKHLFVGPQCPLEMTDEQAEKWAQNFRFYGYTDYFFIVFDGKRHAARTEAVA